MFVVSVVIDDLDVMRIAVVPAETDAPLVVDADAVLAIAVSFQCLQAVAGRYAQVVQRGRQSKGIKGDGATVL